MTAGLNLVLILYVENKVSALLSQEICLFKHFVLRQHVIMLVFKSS